MVKGKTTLSPLVTAAISALALFYPLVFVEFPRTQALHLFVVLSVFFSFAVALRSFLLLYDAASRIVHIQCLAAGLLVGWTSWLLFFGAARAPITLASLPEAERIMGILASDPVPYGEDLYRTDVLTRDVSGPDGARFSCNGRLTVLVPKRTVECMYPGKISGTSAARIFLCSGTAASFEGRFLGASSGGIPVFKAESASPESSPDKMDNRICRFRGFLRLSLMRALYSWKDAGGFLLALTSGDKAYLEHSLSENFKKTGLSHILALSGMHLSLIGLLVSKAGTRAGGIRLSRALVSTVAVAFVWFAGVSPSLNRALIMLLIASYCSSTGIFPSTIALLAASALVQMLVFPADATTLAFMLTYGALAGILLSGTHLSRLFDKRIPAIVRNDLSSSIGAQLMTAPILACTTALLSPVGIIASVIVSPLANLFMVAGSFLAVVGSLCPAVSQLAGSIAGVLYKLIYICVDFFAYCNPLPIVNRKATIAAVLLPVAAMCMIMYAYKKSGNWRTSDDCFAGL